MIASPPVRRRGLLLLPGLALAAIVAALMGPALSASADHVRFAFSWPAPAGAASPSLTTLARQSPDRSVEVIVQVRPGADATAVASEIRSSGGSVLQEIPLIHGVAARMQAGAAASLTARPGVRAVSLDAHVKGQGLVDPSRLATAFNQSIRAEKAWAGGATGKGVGVAVLDTGIAGDLSDFADASGHSRVLSVATVNARARNATDTFGHGTHVAGLIAGNGTDRPAGDPLYGKYAGVAPDANLIAVKADDGNGGTTALDIIDGLQFIYTHRTQFNIRVVNLSIASTVAESYLTDPIDAAVEALWNKGVVVVAAAGNAGTASDAVSYAPGNDPFVITVGGVDDKGTKDINDDQIAGWSSRGVTQDGFAKPDVYAPGAHMVSDLAPNSYYASACPACVVDGQYLRIGGTSMATGVASGAVADILSAHPDWTPNQVKGTLVKRTRTLLAADGASTTDGEIAVDKAIFTNNGQPDPPANGGLAPSKWLDGNGELTLKDGTWSGGSWQAFSWSGFSWSAATGSWAPSWAATSYTPTAVSPNGWTATPTGCARLDRAGWSGFSWSAFSWSSDQLQAAKTQCNTAAQAAGFSWSGFSWSGFSWSGFSWSGFSWSGFSWSTAYDK